MKYRATGLTAYFLLAMNIWLSRSCPEGQFGSPCKPCPPSTYKDHSGDAVECKACPRNSGHVKQGSRTIRDCKCLTGFIGSPELGLPCQIRRCEPLPVPANGYIIGGSCSRNYGSDCNMGCTEGYEAKGSTQRYCVVNAWNAMAWSGSSLTCEVGHCEPLLAPPNGYITNLGGSCSRHYLSVCNMRCNLGYEARGSTQRTCTVRQPSQIMEWSGNHLSCEVIRCPILLVANADPPTGTCTGSQLVPNTRCTFKCRAGYRLKGCKERVCKLDKTWSGNPTTCIV